MLILMFCVCAAGLVLAGLGRPNREPLGLRDALVLGMLATGAWAVAGAELLSIGDRFRPGPVLAWWGAPVIAMLVGLIAMRGRLASGVANLLLRAHRPTAATAFLIGLTASILVLAGIAAVLCPPNTWDCWQYHSPRIFHWLQAGSIDHFAAHDRRQLEMPPMAEFLSAHWAILSGGDWWANMAQWFALLGCALAASIAARELGAGARGQALAAFLAVANPAAATQASSGKNDVVIAFWVLVLAYLGARMWRQRHCDWARAIAIGITLGLLLLTKGTGYLVAAPLCLVIGLAMLRLRGLRAVPLGLAIAVLAAAINVGHWTRNAEAFGSPLGLPQSRGGYPLVATTFTPAALASGIVRNLSTHAVTPWERVNAWEQGAVESLHERVLGIDPSDERTTTRGSVQPFALERTTFSDGNNPAPVHVLLAIGVIVAAIARPRRVGGAAVWAALLVPLVAFLLFATVLRWQPWHLRLQIPFVALWSPVLGLLLPRMAWAPVRGLAVLVAAGLAWVAMLWMSARPLVGSESVLLQSRDQRYFHQAPNIQGKLERAAAAVAAEKPASVGVFMRLTSFEGPVLDLVRRAVGPGVPIVNLNPNDGKSGMRPPPAGPPPDVIIVGDPYPGPIEQTATKRVFVRTAAFSPFAVYISGERVRAVMDRASPPTPAFQGFTVREGLRNEETRADGIVVRWAGPGRTVLNFDSDGSPGLMLAEWRRGTRTDQGATIYLNGAKLNAYEFGPSGEFWPLIQHLRPRRGLNELVIEFKPEAEGFAGRGSLVFRRLQVVKAP